MSRSAAVLILALAAGAAQAADPVATYREKTRVAVQGCSRPADSREIIVCGRRAADRWRVPLVMPQAGDPRVETVSGERNRLASEPRRPCGSTPFLTQCGMVGVKVSTALDGSNVRFRPPAE